MLHSVSYEFVVGVLLTTCGFDCGCILGMQCAMKTNLGKVLADALRYYYFDRYVKLDILG